jgi:hypothetical protein
VSFLFQSGQRIAFVGDERLGAGNPDDAVSQIFERFRVRYPHMQLSCIHRCVPGLRLQEALEIGVLEVDWVIVQVGMHDALRGLELDAFERMYIMLLERFRTRLIICEPCALEPEDRTRLKPYGTLIERIAFESGTPFVPLQRALDRVLPGTSPGDWGSGFRLNRAGSALVTEEFLGAIGFEVFEDDDEPKSEPA